MIDTFGRTIDYIRISITDRCNLRCVYCMPETGIDCIPHGELLTYEEIVQIVTCMAPMGLKHVKITGGEPLVRKGTADLIRRLKGIDGIENVTLTTNGILLPKYMDELRSAGVDGINISLDTLDEERYHRLTRWGHVEDALDGICTALSAKSVRIKINCVLEEDSWEETAVQIAGLAKHSPVHVRFIERMPLSVNEICQNSQEDAVKHVLEQAYGTMQPYSERLGNGPGVYYCIEGFQGKIGFISAVSHRFCGKCNRVRLTSDGILRLCLQSENGTDLKTPLRDGCSLEELQTLILEGIRRKPLEHHFESENIETAGMSKIGG